MNKPYIDKGEVLKYLRYNKNHIDSNISVVIDEMIKEVSNYNYLHKYNFYDITLDNNKVFLNDEDVVFESRHLYNHLVGCKKIAIMCVSISFEFEKKLLQYQVSDLLKSTIFDTCGSVFVEDVCDSLSSMFEKETALYSTRRFSPGYGDLDLLNQTAIFKLLDLNKYGVHLTDSFLCIPRKTVTAIVGFRTEEIKKRKKIVCDCEVCTIPCKKYIGDD